MKQFCILFVFGAVFVARAHAAALGEGGSEKIYDQRQNGTENYRINVDGVFVMIAPAEDLLNAAQGIDLEQLVALADIGDGGFDAQSLGHLTGVKEPKPTIGLLNASATQAGAGQPANASQADAGQPAKPPISPEKKHASANSARLRQRLFSFIRPILRRIRPTVL